MFAVQLIKVFGQVDWVDDSDGWMDRRKEEGRTGGEEEGRKEMGWEGKRALRREEGVKFVGKYRRVSPSCLIPSLGSTITAEIQGR